MADQTTPRASAPSPANASLADTTQNSSVDEMKSPFVTSEKSIPSSQPSPDHPATGPPAMAKPEGTSPSPKPPYTGFSPARRRFILGVVTVAGFFGPLAGGIYLPALPVLEEEFGVGATAINVTVSVFMIVFAFGVSHLLRFNSLVEEVLLADDMDGDAAALLVQLRRLERPKVAVHHLASNLHRCERLAGCVAEELWRASLPQDCAGFWIGGCGVDGCWDGR
jgi:hypothetical protein